MLAQRWHKRCGVILVNLFIVMFISCSILGSMGLGLVPSAWADATTPSTGLAAVDGVALFETHCAGCHPKGGNIIKRGKTLKLKPLTRRHLDSVEAIATFVTQGKGLMSAYGEILTPEDINTVSTYVWEQAQTNWKPIKPHT